MPPSKEELTKRIKTFSKELAQEGLDAAFIIYPLNIFYFSGVFVSGHLLITAQGEAVLFVYRTMGREEKSPLCPMEPLKSLKKLPAILEEFGVCSLGLEEDRLPKKLYNRYESLFKGTLLRDVGEIIKRVRAVKSAYEVSCQKAASKMLAEALDAFLPRLKPGLTELEAAGLLELELRKRGHPAHLRVYGFGQEMAYGHLLSGKSAFYPSFVTTGQGGEGVFGYPQGPSPKKIALNDPILIDYAGWYEAYLIDQTRLFYFGNLPKEAFEIYEKVKFLLDELEKCLRPGVLVKNVYERAHALAEELGISDYFMAHGPERVPFVGHGVGLEIDEWPPVANLEIALQENMVIALEPKCHVPDLGVIGLEDTYLITSNGPKRLTNYPRKFVGLS